MIRCDQTPNPSAAALQQDKQAFHLNLLSSCKAENIFFPQKMLLVQEIT